MVAKFAVVVVALAALSSAGPAGAQSTAFVERDVYEVTGVAADDVLNLRDGPSTRDAIIAGLPNGAILDSAGPCEPHGGQLWCPVEPAERRGLRGWVAARFLKEPGSGSGQGPGPIVVDDYADGLQGGPDFWEVTGVSSTLNMRDRASIEAAVVGRLPAGAVLRNRGCFMVEGRRWCEVESVDGPLRGWVAGAYLREATDVDPLRPWDARDPVTGFHATSRVPCARHAGQPMVSCEAGVRRKEQGAAEVVVFWPDGGSRTIGFEAGEATWSDAEMDMTVGRDGDLSIVTIGPERFEIRDGFPFGG